MVEDKPGEAEDVEEDCVEIEAEVGAVRKLARRAKRGVIDTG